jgi:glycosyltransferase involved in cell wall biosynthesis
MGVYNRASVLRRVLDAVATQTRAPQQVVIVDDGSTDGSGGIIEEWAAETRGRFPVAIRTVPNGGCGAARNRGLEAANDADVYHFLDSDDVIPPDFHERAVAELEAHPAAMAASADQIYVNQHDQELRGRSLAGIEEGPANWLLIHDCGILSATVLRRWVIDRFAPFPARPAVGDDIHVLLPAADLPDAMWVHLPGAPVRYGVLGDNLTTPTPDAYIVWATTSEMYFPPTSLPRWLVGGRISRQWLRAARSCVQDGRRIEGRNCCLRALRRRPLYVDAYVWWIRSWWFGATEYFQRKRST